LEDSLQIVGPRVRIVIFSHCAIHCTRTIDQLYPNSSVRRGRSRSDSRLRL